MSLCKPYVLAYAGAAQPLIRLLGGGKSWLITLPHTAHFFRSYSSASLFLPSAYFSPLTSYFSPLNRGVAFAAMSVFSWAVQSLRYAGPAKHHALSPPLFPSLVGEGQGWGQ